MAGFSTLRPPPPCASRWHRMLAVAVLLAATGCSGAADSPSNPRSTQPPPAPTGTGASVPAFDRGRFAAVIPLPGAATMTVADGRLWVLTGAGTVVQVDPRINAVVGKPLRVPADAEAIAVGAGALWVARVAPGDLATPHKDQVTRIDLASGRVVATIKVRRGPLDLAATLGAVWVTNSGGGGDSVVRIDPHTNRLAGRPVSTGDSPQSLATGGGSLWVANHDARTVTRIDPASGTVLADIPVPSEPHRVAYGAGAAWVGNWHDNSVSRIDPTPTGWSACRSRSGPTTPATWWPALVASGSPATTAPMARPRTWWSSASTQRATERSRPSRLAGARSMSRQPGARSGCRSPTPARSCGSPRANLLLAATSSSRTLQLRVVRRSTLRIS
jgi:YVTN family beta-propeller protein